MNDLPPLTIAVLVNALWFSCLWLDPFDKSLTAEDGEFFGPTGKRKCAMMFHRAEGKTECAALEDGSAVAAFLPLSDEYMSKEKSATTSGPRRASRLQLIVAVDPRSREAPPPTTKGVAELLRSRQNKKVALQLPRTSLELPATSILGELNALGINRCCSFHNEFPGFDNPRDARVDDVLHATKLEFDERGAKGAAVTAVVMVEKAMRMDRKEEVLYVICDHPFFVGVVDSRTNVLIMAGYVYYPTPE